MDLDQFLRAHEIRAPGLMWLLGAGASASAGIPSATHMIWEFKRQIYAAREKISLKTLPDLADRSTQLRLQAYFDSAGGFPPRDAPDEYAAYFETAYPSEGDRRRYIQARVERGVPGFGHFALAVLMKADRARLVWTTNFDRVVEDAAATVFGTTGRLVAAGLGESEVVGEALVEGRWPILGKLHGDFQSRRLKNTEDELREQDGRMRAALIESCGSFGLAVVGYSGRDQSVMDALEEAVDLPGAFPAGLFWFRRTDSPVLDRVDSLIERATSSGVEASLIEVETFDELMSDIHLLERDLPEELARLLEERRPSRAANVAIGPTAGRWPVLRFNALPVVEWPNSARLIRCDIGGTREVREAIETSGAQVIAQRRKAGVICFGSDDDVRRTFSPFDVSGFDVYSIEPKRLRFLDSAELGLLYEAIGRALAREHGLQFHGGRSHCLAIDPSQASEAKYKDLRRAAGGLTGTIGKSGLGWSEAIMLRLEFRLGHLWLLFEPTVWIHRGKGVELDDAAREFVRGRAAGRFNTTWNELIEEWKNLLVAGVAEREVRAFGIGDGIDAVFKLSSVTAFSRRVAG